MLIAHWAHGYLFFLDLIALAVLGNYLAPRLRCEWRLPHVDLAIALMIYIFGHTLDRSERWLGVYFYGAGTVGITIGMMCCVRLFVGIAWGWRAWIAATLAAGMLSAFCSRLGV